MNSVKILHTSKLVLYVELFKNTKIVHVQNQNDKNVSGSFTIFGLFLITLKETTGKIEKRVK